MISQKLKISKTIIDLWNQWISRRIPPATSITLSQESIFILPSRQGWIFVIAILGIFIGGVNYSNSLILGLTFFLFSLFLISIIHTYRNFSGLKIEFVEAQPGFVGEDVIYRFSLSVDDNLSREQISLGFNLQNLEVTDVPNNEKSIIQLFVPVSQRGLHKPGRLLVQSCYPLGILKVWTWVDVQAKSVVYPKILKSSLPLSSGEDNDDHNQVEPIGGTDDFSGLRRYQCGDSLSRVYWKVLSRGQPLASKEFEKPNESYVWLELNQAFGSLEERLSVLTYWVLKYSQDNRQFGLILNEQKIQLGKGQLHKSKCLEALAMYGYSENAIQ